MTLVEDLCSAIRDQRIVRIRYRSDSAFRVCCPHIVYRDSQGVLTLDAYQVGGPSRGTLPEWRRFWIEEIEEVESTKRRFERSADFNPSNDVLYPDIVCSIRTLRAI